MATGAGPAVSTFTLSDGSTLQKVHPATACAGRPCAIHSPSAHHMREWPTRWNEATRAIERQCPHEVWHPDPDDLAFKVDSDSFEAAFVRRLVLRESFASVSLSHLEDCSCDTCLAAAGDEAAERRMLAVFGEPPGVHECDGCCASE